MSPVDFYILHASSRQASDRFVCQLTNKVWHQGYSVYIQCDSFPRAEQLDVMLWTFKDESFLPHEIYPSTSSIATTPILIGYTTNVYQNTDVLINLSETVPTFFEQFKRIADIVENSPSLRESGRNRYRFYKDRHYELRVHEIKN
jgi:DNA polymerase-3 subunit chi